MIENLLIYAIIALALFVIFYREKNDTEIKRKSDAVIEVIAGRYVLKEK